MTDLPRGWTRAPVADLIEEAQPGFPSGRHNSSGVGVPHLRPMNVSRDGRIHLEKVKYVDAGGARIERGDVLFNNTNSPELVGKTAHFDHAGEWAYSNHMTRLRPGRGVDGRFLALQLHWLWMRGFYKSILNNHVNQASVATKTLLSRVELAVPPSAEQRRIMLAIEEQLSRLDSARQLLTSSERRLAVLRAATLDALTDTADTVRLGDLLEDLRYGTSTRCAYDGAGAPVIRIPNVRDRRIDLTDVKKAVDVFADVGELADDDILFVRTNGSRDLIGRVGVVGEEVVGMGFASYLIRARLDHQRADANFVALALSGRALRAEIERKAASTAGQYNLNRHAINELRIPLPSLIEQARVRAAVEVHLSAIERLERALADAYQRAEKLRVAVLTRAFHGDLIVQNPNDEPAGVLLERIAAERTAAPKPKRKAREKTLT